MKSDSRSPLSGSAPASRGPRAVPGRRGVPQQRPLARGSTAKAPASSQARLDRRRAARVSVVVSSSPPSPSSSTPSTDRRRAARISVVASSLSSSSPSTPSTDRPKKKPVSVRLPIGPGDQADQAAAACVAAWRRNRALGKPTRLLVTLSLPLVGATDLDDWPGGIRQQFKAAKPMVERMLSEVRRRAVDAEGNFDPFREAPRPTLWDDADAVVAFDSPRLACVVFPTPETLKRLDELALAKEEKGRADSMTIVVNPQWNLNKGSQLISDFGIGPWKRENERKAASFERAFCLKSVRIRGDEARVWYSAAAEGDDVEFERNKQREGEEEAEPRGPWNLFLVTGSGSMKSSSRLIWSGDEEPSYSRLEELLTEKGDVASKGLFERVQLEAKFLKDSMK